MRNRSDSEIRAAIDSIINEIRRKSEDGDYIYRGERKKYEKVSSSLYREYTEAMNPEDFYPNGFNSIRAQKGILKVAKDHIGESPVGPLEDFIDVARLNKEDVDSTEESGERVFDDRFIKTIETIGETIVNTADQEILTELQHYGGTTNLIDFTTDYRIALYFACSGDYKKIGRVILLKKNKEIEKMLIRPRNPRHRVIAQKSVFLQPPEGYIKEDNIVYIPADLKQKILERLRKFYGISTESIYNDIHGFIRYRNIHHKAYVQSHLGYLVHDRADTAKSPEEKKRAEYEKAIEHYTRAVNLNPDLGGIYCNRGEARLHLKAWEDARKDFVIARDMGIDIVASFRKDYKEGVKEFEEKTGIVLPTDIAGILDNISWTVERFNELVSSQEYREIYESRNRTEKLCEFGAGLMDLAGKKRWKLIRKFNKYYFALYFGRRRVFGVNLHGRPKLTVWLPDNVLSECSNDLFDDPYPYIYHDSHRCGIYSEDVTVSNIEKLLEFAYLWHAGLLV